MNNAACYRSGGAVASEGDALDGAPLAAVGVGRAAVAIRVLVAALVVGVWEASTSKNISAVAPERDGRGLTAPPTGSGVAGQGHLLLLLLLLLRVGASLPRHAGSLAAVPQAVKAGRGLRARGRAGEGRAARGRVRQNVAQEKTVETAQHVHHPASSKKKKTTTKNGR